MKGHEGTPALTEVWCGAVTRREFLDAAHQATRTGITQFVRADADSIRVHNESRHRVERAKATRR